MSKRRIDLFLGLWHFLLPKVAGKMAPVLTVLGWHWQDSPLHVFSGHAGRAVAMKIIESLSLS